MAEMRKCKECGKLFQPKGREQYCPEIHYRPCPVCGEPVVAKYLSDPARRCEKCKGKSIPTLNPIKPVTPIKPVKPLFKINPISIKGEPKKQESQPASRVDKKDNKQTKYKINLDGLERIPAKVDPTMFLNTVSGSTCRFVRKDPLCGWIPGRDYTVEISRDSAAYTVASHNEDGDKIALRCTSQTSFFNYFRKVKD